ncbi:MAG: DUF993 family protein, partial [Alicyclobacillus sp.]|nr:DUF993 family protein [Alicyclobacillus sp.]
MRLPQGDGTWTEYVPGRRPPVSPVARPGGFQSRVALAAAHVVCDPLADGNPLADVRIDWE